MAQGSTIYRGKKAASLTNPTSASTFVQSDDSTKAVVVYFPVLSSDVKEAAFRFRALGHTTTVGSHNNTPKVSFGSSATAATNTVIAAATARAIATTTAGWMISGELYWDSLSSTLKGWFTACNGSTNVLDVPAIITTKTAVDLTTTGNALSVECTVATGGGDVAFLDELALEVL